MANNRETDLLTLRQSAAMEDVPRQQSISKQSKQFNMVQASCALLQRNDTAPEETRYALALICAAARSKSTRDRILNMLDLATVERALAHNDPKVRKNAARLCARMQSSEFAPPILKRCKVETQQYVRPALVEALLYCAYSDMPSQEYLAERSVELENAKTLDKHERAELAALTSASQFYRKASEEQPVTFIGLNRPRRILLTCVPGHANIVVQEARELGIELSAKGNDTLGVNTRDLDTLRKLRTVHEILFPLGTHMQDTADTYAVVGHALQDLMLQTHNLDAIRYRIEVRPNNGLTVSQEQRSGWVQRIKEAFTYATPAMLNSTSDYQVELRVILHSQSHMSFYAKFYTLPDERFAYRTNSVAAALNPVCAATLLRCSQKFLHPDARVLDPFCGGGTLLVERAKLMPCASLTGVDRSAQAVNIARENIKAAELDAYLVHCPIELFKTREPYQEIISNLPFGIRVGNHDKNLELYQAFFNRLGELLTPGGHAMLLSAERMLLRSEIDKHPELELVARTRLPSGGLFPELVILQYKP